ASWVSRERCNSGRRREPKATKYGKPSFFGGQTLSGYGTHVRKITRSRMEGDTDMVKAAGKGVGCTPTSMASKTCMWGWGWGRVGLAAIAVMAGMVATPVRAVATINPVVLPEADCPSNLMSCTANDVTTTVKAVDILHDDLCESLDDTIDL